MDGYCCLVLVVCFKCVFGFPQISLMWLSLVLWTGSVLEKKVGIRVEFSLLCHLGR